MKISRLNGYINPFSIDFKQSVKKYRHLRSQDKALTLCLSILAGLGTLFLGGIGGYATFRSLVENFNNKKSYAVSIKTNQKTRKMTNSKLAHPKEQISKPFKQSNRSVPPANKLRQQGKTKQKNDPIQKTEQLKADKNAASLQAEICIGYETGGYVGESTKRQLLPNYLEHIRLPNGDRLPLVPEDYFIQFELFNLSKTFERKKIPTTMVLPSIIFQNNKDGDIVKLKYDNELIELKINQNKHDLKFSKGTFKQVLSQQESYIANHHDSEDPCYGIHDPFWYYGNLDSNRTIYKLSVKNPEKDVNYPNLRLAKPSEFRPKINPRIPPAFFELSDDDKFVHFAIELSRFLPDDIDIIVNNKFIIFYAEFHDRPVLNSPIVWDSQSGENTKASKAYWEELLSPQREVIYPFRWDRSSKFKHLSLEQMKQLIQRSNILFTKGVLSFNLPTTIE